MFLAQQVVITLLTQETMHKEFRGNCLDVNISFSTFALIDWSPPKTGINWMTPAKSIVQKDMGVEPKIGKHPKMDGF